MIRIGDYTHGLVLLLQIGFLYSMTSKDLFSKSFIEDGFCVSNKENHYLYQSHALAFYSDTIFSIILFYMYKNIKVDSNIETNNNLLEPVKANIGAIFFHGLGHLNLAFSSKFLSKSPLWFNSSMNTYYKLFSILVLYYFWYFLVKAAYLNGTTLQWRINSIIHTILITFLIPFNYSFTYVQTSLMLTASLSELKMNNKNIFYDIKAIIIHLPITIIGWIEAVFCDNFIEKYGGHLIYDTTIPLSVITYHGILYSMYTKKKENIE